MNKEKLNPARSLYYGFLSKLFVFTNDKDRYLGVDEILDILIDNPLDENSCEALKEIKEFIHTAGYEAFIEEYDALFHSPVTQPIRTTASFYLDGIESGRKTLEVKNFLARTKIRKNEKTFKEPEDSMGFLLTFMYELVELNIMGESAYKTVEHCLFVEVINEFVDMFIENLYENKEADIYKSVAIVFNAFVEFERLYFDVQKPKPKEMIQKKNESCEFISDEEAKRRSENRIKKSAESLISSCALEDEYFEKE